MKRSDPDLFAVGSPRAGRDHSTLRYDGMEEKLRPFGVNVALLPINPRSPERRVAGNLSGPGAAEVAHDIGAKLVIPCHFDMFECNTARPDEFVRTCHILGARFPDPPVRRTI